VPRRKLAVARLIREHVWVGQARLDVGELGLETREALQHADEVPGSRAPVARHGDDFGRMRQPLGERSRRGVVVALRHCEHQAGTRGQGEARFSRGGNEIEVDANRARHDDVVAYRACDVAFTQADSRAGRRRGFEAIDTDPLRIVAQCPTQPPLRHQLIERVRTGVGTAVLLDDRHDPLERIRRSKIAVQHRRELPIGLTDADLETTVRDARHLEAAQLSRDVIAFSDDFETRVLEQEPKLRRVVGGDGGRKRLGIGRVQLSAPKPPHRRRVAEERGTTCEYAGVVFDEQMQFVQAMLPAPRHRLAQSTNGVTLDEQPTLRARRSGRASGERSGHGGLDSEMRAHERGQLRLQQRPAALGFESVLRVYDDDFLRRP
jgi:hypothetical protein